MTSIQKQIGRFYRLFTYRIGTNGDPDLIELEDGKVKINGVIYTAGNAPFYGCRAWVNFDGGTAANQAATYSRTGTTVTVTLANHGYLAGHLQYHDFTSGGAADGLYEITSVISPDAYTITTAASGTIAAGSTVNLLRRAIRASGNVHSVSYFATGGSVINFLTPMEDDGYGAWIQGVPDGSSAAGLWRLQGIKTTHAIQFYTYNTSANVDFVLTSAMFIR